MSKHTPGPCRKEIYGGDSKGNISLLRYDGVVILPAHLRVDDSILDRIVECVNACEGIENPKALKDLIESCRLLCSEHAEPRDFANVQKALAALGVK